MPRSMSRSESCVSTSAESFTPVNNTAWLSRIGRASASRAMAAATVESSSAGWLACTTTTQVSLVRDRIAVSSSVTRDGSTIGRRE